MSKYPLSERGRERERERERERKREKEGERERERGEIDESDPDLLDSSGSKADFAGILVLGKFGASKSGSDCIKYVIAISVAFTAGSTNLFSIAVMSSGAVLIRVGGCHDSFVSLSKSITTNTIHTWAFTPSSNSFRIELNGDEFYLLTYPDKCANVWSATIAALDFLITVDTASTEYFLNDGMFKYNSS
eukprot:sb/3471153/